MRHPSKYRRGGFTLLELMLVLGILAMLALFVVPRFMGAGKAMRIDAAKSMVGPSGTLAKQIDLFYQRMGRFPEELVDLVEKPDWLDDEDDRWYQFIKDPEFKDPWRRELIYKQPGDVNEDEYDLVCLGPDGEEDTDDDITNFRKE